MSYNLQGTQHNLQHLKGCLCFSKNINLNLGYTEINIRKYASYKQNMEGEIFPLMYNFNRITYSYACAYNLHFRLASDSLKEQYKSEKSFYLS